MMRLIENIRREPARVAFGRGPSASSGSVTVVALDSTRDDDQVTITADDGSFVVIPSATGSVAGVFSAADKTRLDQLATGSGGAQHDFATVAEAAAANVPAFQEFLRTAGYYAAGDGGGALYRRVGSEPAHALKLQTADGARWELVPALGTVSVLQAGAKGDGQTDDAPAIQAAIDAFSGLLSGGDPQGDPVPTVLIPLARQDHYRCASTLKLTQRVRLVGQSGYEADLEPQLIFDPDVAGIEIHLPTTDGPDATVPARTDGSWAVIEHLAIAGTGSDPAAHGIIQRGKAQLKHVSIYRFGGDGLHAWADVTGGSAPFGNVNNSVYISLRCRNNGGSGVSLRGGDANAMIFLDLNCFENGRFGLHDRSTLGNYVWGAHFDANGNPNVGKNPPTSTCRVTFGGVRYHAVHDATAEALAATEPGTDAAVWRPVGPGGADAQVLAWQPGQPVGTYHAGGAFAVTGQSATTVIVGYVESNQAPGYLSAPARFDGQATAADLYGDGLGVRGQSALTGRPMALIGRDGDSRDHTLALRDAADVYWSATAGGDAGGRGLVLRWLERDGTYELAHNNQDGRVAMQIASELASIRAGRGEALPAGMPTFPLGLVPGGGTQGRVMTAGTEPPASGRHARGEIVFNTRPSAGGTAGWICVTTGTPGIWKGFGRINA